MVEAFALVLLWQALPIQLGSLQQTQSTHHVSLSECEWVLDRAVYMTLSSQVDDTVNLLVLHELVECVEVADVHLNELVVWFVLDVLQVSQVTSVGKLVEVNDVILGILVHKQADYM